MKSPFLLAGILAAAHLILVVALFVSIESSDDRAAGMAWALLEWIDFPSYLLTTRLIWVLWRSGVAWYSDESVFSVLCRRAGVDQLNAGYALLHAIAGTLQWGVVGYLLQRYVFRAPSPNDQSLG